MNIKELAKELGVSRSTFSKVINAQPGVAKKTEDRIKKFLKEKNFFPNDSALSLAGKRNKIIGIIVKAHSRDLSRYELGSSFYKEFISMGVIEAQNREYKALTYMVTKESDYNEVNRYLAMKLISGAVFIGFENDDELLKDVIKKHEKIVLINQFEEKPYEHVKLVNMADEEVSKKVLKKFIDRGHKEILYISTDTKRLSAIRRRKGVDRCAALYDKKIGEIRIEKGDYSKKSGYEVVKKIFEKGSWKPTLIYAANDLMAIGGMEALKDLKINVPDEVSVIGFDDIEISKYLTPKLSTVRADFITIIKKGIGTLIDYIEEKPCQDIWEISGDYVERDSTKNI